ncbi:MAG: Trm112 family protein [bacterium]|nr:Trm112 family protein [bacterium]
MNEAIQRIAAIQHLLACPETKVPLVLVKQGENYLLVTTDPSVPRYYPIIDGIPELLIESAVMISPEEHTLLLKNRVEVKSTD